MRHRRLISIMRVCLVTPVPPGSRKGNRVTAVRWARIIRNLGHEVVVAQEYADQSCDVLVALHARRSLPSIQRFRGGYPERPLIVALTGTDLYGDLRSDPLVVCALQMASRLVLLQPLGVEELPESVRGRARVIYQSAVRPPGVSPPLSGTFDVCVLAHLRDVKDPLRAARAARHLPVSSRIRVLHAGGALSAEMAQAAASEMRVNPRYRWLGELPRWKALRLLARSRLLVLSSSMEGGANVLSEAVAASVPALVSRIPGSMGILGEDYPGTFAVGDTRALTSLLRRVETDAEFYRALQARCNALRPLVEPARERRAWAALFREFAALRQGVRAS